jgi:CheY-like chemotaxis protein
MVLTIVSMGFAGTGARRILVVEDDLQLRESVSHTLSEEGYDVCTARNGAEALELAARSPPDLVLLDLMMPVMSGWEFRERQRRHPELAAIPVVVMTATPSLEAAAIEAADLLLKPVRPSDLLATVVRHIGEAFDEPLDPVDNDFADAPNTEPNAPRLAFEDHDSNRHH